MSSQFTSVAAPLREVRGVIHAKVSPRAARQVLPKLFGLRTVPTREENSNPPAMASACGVATLERRRPVEQGTSGRRLSGRGTTLGDGRPSRQSFPVELSDGGSVVPVLPGQ